jgi:glycosyltransferase involved in cell wall biosynthesis
MRILQIHPFMKSESLAPAAGGMQRAALQLTRMLAMAGHDVRVLPVPEGVGSRVLWEVAPARAVEVAPAMDIPAWGDVRWLAGALLRIRPKPGSLRAVYYDACALAALRRAVRSFHPDVIHNHLARAPFPRLLQSLDLPQPAVLTHHHGETGERLDAYRRIVFPSDSILEKVVRESGFPRNRARRVYCPVNPVFTGKPAAAAGKRSGIYYVGAVRVRKGIDLLLDAYRLDRSLRAEPLHICGSGQDHHLVAEAIRQGKLPIVDEGMCSPEKIAQKLRSARLVVVPSRLEGFSVALLEALACGTPVVGWAPQVRELEINLSLTVGFPFDGRTQNAGDLAVVVRQALDGECMRLSNRRALAEAAQQAFSESEFLAGNLRVYRELA